MENPTANGHTNQSGDDSANDQESHSQKTQSLPWQTILTTTESWSNGQKISPEKMEELKKELVSEAEDLETMKKIIKIQQGKRLENLLKFVNIIEQKAMAGENLNDMSPKDLIRFFAEMQNAITETQNFVFAKEEQPSQNNNTTSKNLNPLGIQPLDREQIIRAVSFTLDLAKETRV
jgi:hypothetical protein